MSIWQDRILNHQVWAEMKSLGPSIDKAAHREEVTEDAREALERLRTVLSVCGKRLGGSDPQTVVPSTLDNLANWFNTMRQQVDTYASDGNISHLTDANSNADAVLIALGQIPGTNTPEELIQLIQLISRYRSELDGAARDWSDSVAKTKGQVSDLQTAVTQVHNQLEAEKQKITNQAIDFQKSFADAQEARSNTYTETLRKTQETLSSTLSEQQGQFSTSQENRGKEFTDAQAARQDKFGQALNEYLQRLTEQNTEFTRQRDDLTRKSEESLGELNTQYSTKAGAILSAVEEQKVRVEKLVGVIGNLGVTSGYLKDANQARWAMWGWQAGTVTALVALSWLAFRTLPLLEDRTGKFNWGGFAARVLLLASIGVIAAYARSQGDKLFEVERRNRKLALELEAIGPYLAPLPEEEQNKFRVQVGERSFGRDDDLHRRAHGESPANLVDLLESKESKTLLDLAADFI